MSDQVRGIVFVVISLLILFAWGHFYKPPVPPPQTNPSQTAAPVSQQNSQQASSQQGAAGKTSSGAAKKSSGTAAAGAEAANSSVVEASEEKTVVVESPLHRVELSNSGGVVKTWQLNKYFDDQKPPHPLDLVNDSVAQELGWPFSLVLADSQLEAKANSALYQVQAYSAQVVVVEKTGAAANSAALAAAVAAGPTGAGPFQAPIKIIFHWSDGHLDVTKSLNF